MGALRSIGPAVTRLGPPLGLAVAAAAVVSAIGLSGSPLAAPLGALISGLTAVAGGGLALVRTVPIHRRELFRVLIGSAALVWGLGQVLLGINILQGATYPTPGDAVSVLAGPLAIAGLSVAPRRTAEVYAGLRLCADSLLVGSAAAILVWRTVFLGALDPGTGGGQLGVAVLLVELSVVALLFIAALRELDEGMVVTAVGVATFVTADIWTQAVVIQPGQSWSWAAMALTCLSWPLVCAGLLRISAAPPDLSDLDRPRSERRRSVIISVVTGLVLAGALVSLLGNPVVDRVSIVLTGIFVAASAVREVLLAMQASHLLTRVARLAHRDALTGLGNRRALLDDLGRQPAPSWLLTVDLDNFRSVNSLLGHSGGDELLRRAGDQLDDASGTAAVYRLGGDEFAVLATGDESDIERLSDQLVAAVRVAALTVPGVGRVALSASVGRTLVRVGAAPLEALAESATAMHAAKAAGRNRSAEYAGPVAASTERRRLVEKRLREALNRGEIIVHAQPLVRLVDGSASGVEFLARWNDAELGRVTPDEFIAVAEATSLIVSLGEQVLTQAIAAAAHFDFETRDLSFGVNVSPVQLRVPGFAHTVRSVLDAHGVLPRRLVVEVTEQVFVGEHDDAEAELHRLAAHGVTIAVDDFGSGSASLGYLRRMPAAIVKIDRSLVASMLHDRRSAAIVTSMSSLCAEMGVDVLAEGIEEEAVAAACRAAGIDYGQGWLWARAVPLEQLVHALETLSPQRVR